jgi:hypothetical protein
MPTYMSFDGRVFKLTRQAEFRGGSKFLDLQEFLDPSDAGPTRDEGLPPSAVSPHLNRESRGSAAEARAEPVSKGAGFASPHVG